MLGLISLPNILTFANLLCGAAAIAWAAQGGEAKIALCWVLGSVLFDTLDGWAARRLGKQSSFGAIFDSAADFVSFGAAPVVIFYAAVPAASWLAFLGSLAYILAAAFRLIRFHLEYSKTTPGTYQGLPTTASAFIFVCSMWFYPTIWVLWALAALMVSRLPVSRPLNGQNDKIKS